MAQAGKCSVLVVHVPIKPFMYTGLSIATFDSRRVSRLCRVDVSIFLVTSMQLQLRVHMFWRDGKDAMDGKDDVKHVFGGHINV